MHDGINHPSGHMLWVHASTSLVTTAMTAVDLNAFHGFRVHVCWNYGTITLWSYSSQFHFACVSSMSCLHFWIDPVHEEPSLWQLVPRLLPNFYLNFFSETHKSVTSVPCLHMPLEHVPCRYHFVYLCMLQFLVNISAATQWFHIHFQLPHIFWTHGSIDIVDAASWFYTAISGCCASLLSTLGWHIGMSQACREEMLMG